MRRALVRLVAARRLCQEKKKVKNGYSRAASPSRFSPRARELTRARKLNENRRTLSQHLKLRTKRKTLPSSGGFNARDRNLAKSYELGGREKKKNIVGAVCARARNPCGGVRRARVLKVIPPPARRNSSLRAIVTESARRVQTSPQKNARASGDRNLEGG